MYQDGNNKGKKMNLLTQFRLADITILEQRRKQVIERRNLENKRIKNLENKIKHLKGMVN